MKKLSALVKNELVCTQRDNKPYAIARVIKPFTYKYPAQVGRTIYNNPSELFYELHELDNTNREVRIVADSSGKQSRRAMTYLTELEECWFRGFDYLVKSHPLEETKVKADPLVDYGLEMFLGHIQSIVRNTLWQYATGEIEQLVFFST